MAANPHFGVLGRNAAINAVTARLNSALMKFYDGAQPADCSVAVSTQNLLATITFPNPAFAAASAGAAALNGVPLTVTIAASGTVAWFRIFDSGGTVAEHDGNVGIVSVFNCIVDNTSLAINATLAVNTGSISHAA